MSIREKYLKELRKNKNRSKPLFPSSEFTGKLSKADLLLAKVKRIFVRRLGFVKILKPKNLQELEQISGHDRNKRIRMIASSVIIVVAFALFRQFGVSVLSELKILEVAGLFSLLSSLLVLVVFWGEVDLNNFVKISFFIGISILGIILFLELFFLNFFVFVYEVLSYILVLMFMLGFVYLLFLTSNIINVSKYKVVPLLQVAQTMGYIISAVNVFFLTLAALTLNIQPYFLLLLFPLYSMMIYSLVSTFGFSRKANVLYSIGIGWICFLPLIGVYFWPVEYRMAAVLPTISMVVVLGIAMTSWRKKLNLVTLIENGFVLILVIYVLLRNANY